MIIESNEWILWKKQTADLIQVCMFVVRKKYMNFSLFKSFHLADSFFSAVGQCFFFLVLSPSVRFRSKSRNPPLFSKRLPFRPRTRDLSPCQDLNFIKKERKKSMVGVMVGNKSPFLILFTISFDLWLWSGRNFKDMLSYPNVNFNWDRERNNYAKR